MRKRLSLSAIEAIEERLIFESGSKEKTVFGVVNKNGNIVRKLKDVNGSYTVTFEDHHVEIPEKLEPILTRPKRFIIVIGGRGSGKSQGIAIIEAARMKDYGIKIGCFREFQNSIEDSVYSLLDRQLQKIDPSRPIPIKGTIKSSTNGVAKFKGVSRNPDSVKSMDDFMDFWGEESQAFSANSLKLITPTMRADGGRIIFIANPGSSEDPFSTRFITPFMDKLLSDGSYEDGLHLVIMMNWQDNPWFPEGLRQEMEWDKQHLSSALYEHIWEGAFNDSVDDALIMSEWFDACVDAHIKLGFSPLGVKIASHDPSDTGPDPKGYCQRHGSVITDVQEKSDGTINDGGDWATGLTINFGADYFTWDCDGMGVGLQRQVGDAFEGKPISISMFRGSESPDFPDALFAPSVKSPIAGQKTNKESFRNKRAQYYMALRERCYKTYLAVVHGKYFDPSELISFSSEIKLIKKLRSELCRMPIKPNGNGLFELYTKEEMKSKFKFKSPNLADAVMMSMRFINIARPPVKRPTPIKTMGIKR
jgi:phage terminase large subunit